VCKHELWQLTLRVAEAEWPFLGHCTYLHKLRSDPRCHGIEKVCGFDETQAKELKL
jgi:hypothetical protein